MDRVRVRLTIDVMIDDSEASFLKPNEIGRRCAREWFGPSNDQNSFEAELIRSEWGVGDTR